MSCDNTKSGLILSRYKAAQVIAIKMIFIKVYNNVESSLVVPWSTLSLKNCILVMIDDRLPYSAHRCPGGQY